MLFQLAEFGPGEAAAVMIGGVLSNLTVTDVLSLFPALSVAVPETTWFAPSLVKVWAGGQTATPDVASLHMKVTVTLVLFQPAALGAGDTIALIAGRSLSTPTATVKRMRIGFITWRSPWCAARTREWAART